MATKRKPINAKANLNYRPSNEMKVDPKGTKPTTDPTSVAEIMALMVLYICKKSIFYNTNHKVAIYLGTLFLISLLADFNPFPRTYLSRSDNILNRVFVKYAWSWNLVLLTPFVTLTSFIYCCGDKHQMIKHHISRLGIATIFWLLWTFLFNIIESGYGKCTVRGEHFNTKQSCLKGGFLWNGFDISGHSFILVFGSLMLIEETRSIVKWDSIKDYIRLEEYYRVTNDKSYSTNPLKALTQEQFNILQQKYEPFTVYIRAIFVVITLLNIFWDLMLLSTMMYYHVMIEKFLGGFIGVTTWLILYRIWYPSNYLPRMPGDGVFKYTKIKQPQNIPAANTRRRTGSIVNGSQPKFMGRTLYPTRAESPPDE